jgi:hypothetical protein
LRYRLPFNFFQSETATTWRQRLNDWLNPQAGTLHNYSLMVQKQPGAKADAFSSRLLLPASVRVFWRYPENLAGEDGWDIQTDLSRDKYWSIISQPNQSE